MEIKLYEGNNINEEYELHVRDIVKRMLQWEREYPRKAGFHFERRLMLFITDTEGLNSTTENVPLKKEELEAIWNEYKEQTGE